jgi:hypothetical protein
MRSSGHLTERLISKLAVGLHHDGEGLYAQVTLGLQHNVSWVLRYTLPEKVISKNRKTRNKERRAGLGRYPAHHTLPGRVFCAAWTAKPSAGTCPAVRRFCHQALSPTGFCRAPFGPRRCRYQTLSWGIYADRRHYRLVWYSGRR